MFNAEGHWYYIIFRNVPVQNVVKNDNSKNNLKSLNFSPNPFKKS